MVELLPLSQAWDLRENLGEFLTTTFSVSEPATRQALNEFLEDPQTGLFKGPYTRLRLPFAPSHDNWENYVPTLYKALEEQGALKGPSAFQPYGHQVEAWKRITTADGHEPQPTLVTTGTGSGKTEAFLMPVLDHCARANAAGITGTKAIILYPMNALANDQAARLAELISTTEPYKDVTAAIYTGEQKSKEQRTKVSKHGLINVQDIIRSDAPDILLTNYKMLDHLLLRHADANIWKQSADSLTYLVLDEFHAYDGAQGTDVAMLLRRLGLTLKAEASPLRSEDWTTPLGPITPIATSATMGGDDDAEAMLGFASQVLGLQLGDDAVVTETRMSWGEWSAGAREHVESKPPGRRALRSPVKPAPFTKSVATDTLKALKALSGGEGETLSEVNLGADPSKTTRLVLERLYTAVDTDEEDEPKPVDFTKWSDEDLLNLVKAHPVFEALQAAASEATDLDTLAKSIFGARLTSGQKDFDPITYVSVLLTTLSHLRAEIGRQALSVDTHIWVREVRRIDRILSGDVPRFRWADDGQPDAEAEAALPAVYCRSCGRTGWMIALQPTGTDLDMDDATIRKRSASQDPRTRALIHAKAEAEEERTPGGNSGASDQREARYMWLLSEARSFESPNTSDPAEGYVAGERIPVFVDLSKDGDARAQDQTCPSCGAEDSIRYLGSAAATLLSVSLTGLLGTPHLDEAERKALVFTDSVQDAAHRAGFIQARSHALTLRTAIRETLGSHFVPSTDLSGAILAAADKSKDPAEARFALLPPQLEDDKAFEAFWKSAGARKQNAATRNMRKRLAFDVGLEFGLRSDLGRTLENTGTATVMVDKPEGHLLAVAKRVAGQYMTGTIGGVEASDSGSRDSGTEGSDGGSSDAEGSDVLTVTDADLLRWVYGVLHHMRTSGAVAHQWYEKYRDNDGNAWWLTGGRARGEGMPGFGGRVGTPRFPISKSSREKHPRLEPTPATAGWYGTWTGKALGAPTNERGTLARELLEELAAEDLIETRKTASGASTYALRPEDVLVRSLSAEEAESGLYSLQCDMCGQPLFGDKGLTEHLLGGPCLAARCSGTLHPHSVEPNFYQNLYRDSGLLKVVAREHTSLLPDELRVKYEDEFKAKHPSPDAPNVLVATPTLEMGIDIGDLSAVMLSSLPRTVASYLQRVGRAGRLTGNSLTVAFVTTRGEQLRLFQEPLETINGEVVPPATFLRALEILKRQYVAAVADRLARDKNAPHPTSSKEAMARGKDTYLDALVQLGREEEVVEDFLSMFLTPGDQILTEHTKQALRDWVKAPKPDEPVGIENPSGLWERCEEAALRWERRIEELTWRADEIAKTLPALEKAASAPAATREDMVAARTARGSRSLAYRERADLTGQYWVSTLEGAGLFPNYTLLDDSVTLDVTLSWIEPDTQQWQEGEFDITRGSAQALRDFAPGATFYVRGLAVDVDAVDLGRNRDAVERWALCAACGFVKPLGVSLGEDETNEDGSTKTLEKAPKSCPRCGDERIGDAAQQIHVVKLERVSAVMRRDKAQISDTMSERRNAWFEMADMADMDPSHTTSWYVDGEDFGVRHSTSLTMRWLNLGKKTVRGEPLLVSGVERQGPQFTVCSYCGQEDTEPGANSPREHRPWCPRRNDLKASTVKVSLARQLEGEGLLIRVPRSMTVGDSFALPSLMAAVRLAFERHLGRADHLAVTEGKDPSGEGVGAGILIYDTVPGGTGYLGELAALSDDGKPHVLWQILKDAYDYLSVCPCADGELSACEKCLLPYAPHASQKYLSREAAVRLLGELLVLGQPSTEDGEDSEVDAEALQLRLEAAREDPWPGRTEEPPTGFSIESHLEGAFREAASAMFKAQGWSVKALPAPGGDALVLSKSRLKWRLDPQVSVKVTKPDFLLHVADPNVPQTAVYTDGRQYHFASGQYNRVGDDAMKRQHLRDAGYRVLGMTSRDVEEAQEATRSGGGNGVAPKWFTRKAAQSLVKANIPGLSAGSFKIIGMDALHLLQDYMSSSGARLQADQVAKWLPAFFVAAPGSVAVAVEPGQSLLDVNYNELKRRLSPAVSSQPPSSPKAGDDVAYVWVDGALAVGVRALGPETMEIAVLLEDGPKYVGPGYEDSWRSWLHISNLLAGRVDPTIITTTSRLKEDHGDQFAQAFLVPEEAPTAEASDEPADGGSVDRERVAGGEDAGGEQVSADVYARWQHLFEDTFDEEKEALETLMSEAPDLPLPTVGAAGPGGSGVPIGWAKPKIALDVDLDEEMRSDLLGAGWVIIPVDAEQVWEALRSRGF